jgi:hypothetical protein
LLRARAQRIAELEAVRDELIEACALAETALDATGPEWPSSGDFLIALKAVQAALAKAR